jgi:hypothetical protein
LNIGWLSQLVGKPLGNQGVEQIQCGVPGVHKDRFLCSIRFYYPSSIENALPRYLSRFPVVWLVWRP